MESEFRITDSFDEDMKSLPTGAQNKVKDEINFV